jgi:hypothetical protein
MKGETSSRGNMSEDLLLEDDDDEDKEKKNLSPKYLFIIMKSATVSRPQAEKELY